MMKELNFKVAPTFKAPTDAIVRVEPKLLTDCAKCEGNINIGLFFDGTNNNMDADSSELGDSNIVRLFNSYREKKSGGYYRRYIPGVGTPFPEIREEGTSSLGTGFAIGCEERVLFSLLWVLNTIHGSSFNEQPFFEDAQIKALCCCQEVNPSVVITPDASTLMSMGLYSGLRMPDLIGEGSREKILKEQVARLEKKLLKGKPVIKECFIDVFGFSRGAAEARVFCRWLNDLINDGKLAGIVVHFRFLGLIDTVASAGFWSSIVAATTGLDGGHSGWADSQFLRIPASIKNCLHMVAMHELRKNFPLDTITIDGVLPPHCQEFAYPGAHSDVGGGYKPGELGISFGKDAHEGDALKLSQIPLNHMFECAVAAGVPMDKALAVKSHNPKPFQIDPRVQKAYDDFLTSSTLKPRAVHEWLQPYLNWRWEVRMSYANLNHVRKANKKEAARLIEYNNYLLADAYALELNLKPHVLDFVFRSQKGDAKIMGAASLIALDKEAPTVLARAKAAAPAPAEAHVMFDYFVHDSLAGFDHHNLELSGHWRYRKGFLGSPKRLIAENDNGSNSDKAASTG